MIPSKAVSGIVPLTALLFYTIIAMILFLQHIDIEGPGTIETYFHQKGFQSRIIALYDGEKLPAVLDNVEAVIAMGGPMNVYEETKYPFLADENIFIKKALSLDVPFLGVCLGSQLLAKAGGAEVTKSPVKEVGWFQVQMTNEGKMDPLFAGLGSELDVYHWHEDMFGIPPGGKLLATSPGCPHQAFRIGKNAYGLQFHVEVTDCIIGDWCKRYFQEENPVLQKDAHDMLQEYHARKDKFNQTAGKLFENFSRILSEKKFR